MKRLLELRSTSVGSMEYHVLAAGLPPGPQSVQDLASWPCWNLDTLWGCADDDELDSLTNEAAVHRRRVEGILSSGMVLHSDCSGKLSPEAAFKMTEIAMRSRGCKVMQEPVFAMWRACDNSPLCQRVIGNSKLRPVHSFAGMLEKLPEEHRRQIEQRRPPPEASRKERIKAYCEMDVYLRKKSATLYNRAAQSKSCLLHPASDCYLAISGD